MSIAVPEGVEKFRQEDRSSSPGKGLLHESGTSTGTTDQSRRTRTGRGGITGAGRAPCGGRTGEGGNTACLTGDAGRNLTRDNLAGSEVAGTFGAVIAIVEVVHGSLEHLQPRADRQHAIDDATDPHDHTVVMTATAAFRAIGVECRIVATRLAEVPAARELAQARLGEVDAVASRFRPDSEVIRLAHTPATTASNDVTASVSPLLRSLIEDALWAAEATGALVDPTLGRAMETNGYDADLAEVLARPARINNTPTEQDATVPSMLGRLSVDAVAGTVTFAAGTLLDLGATAKAAMADRLARELAGRGSGGFLVELGGDIAVAGRPPTGGWVISTEDSADDARVVVTTQGVATSGTDRRRWYAEGVSRHHLLDPSTGRPVPDTWRQVTCVAASALEANAASTAACVLGAAAPDWLASRGIPARLVPDQGDVVRTPGWPRPARSIGQAS
jgi:FAD:protein FMN transferase